MVLLLLCLVPVEWMLTVKTVKLGYVELEEKWGKEFGSELMIMFWLSHGLLTQKEEILFGDIQRHNQIG